MGAMRLAACALALAITACSPWSGGAAYHCETDAQCTGGPGVGRCEVLSGFCSFGDLECVSGQRYGSSSGSLSGVCVGDEPPIDAAVDSSIDTPPGYIPDARQCFGTPVNVCLTVLGTGPRNLTGAISTDTGCDQIELQAGGPELCIVRGETITVGAVRATGARPLVIVATSTITISGALDVSSGRTGTAGAAANAAVCVVAGNGENDAGGGAGAGGGGFGAAGGSAGKADTNDSAGNDGDSNGGAGGSMLLSTFVRGGCKGGKGGNGSGGNMGGQGSNGGGAVYLIAGTSITVATGGSINAGGGGGNSSDNGSGGGGGGSGGMIGLDAPALVISGAVTANGGGGGGGGGNTRGGDGGDATTGATYNQRAAGGTGGTQVPAQNTPGGRGGALADPTGENAPASVGGGGGGGGSVGVIWTHGTVTGTLISPAATPK